MTFHPKKDPATQEQRKANWLTIGRGRFHKQKAKGDPVDCACEMCKWARGEESTMGEKGLALIHTAAKKRKAEGIIVKRRKKPLKTEADIRKNWASSLKVTHEERERIKQVAVVRGMPVSRMIREILLEEVKRFEKLICQTAADLRKAETPKPTPREKKTLARLTEGERAAQLLSGNSSKKGK